MHGEETLGPWRLPPSLRRELPRSRQLKPRQQRRKLQPSTSPMHLRLKAKQDKPRQPNVYVPDLLLQPS
ncbi:hypothetical protein DVH24_033963 [Malus domestica]|uniref:Uncharacterized protein n=1 Tax=Malus domestica TaxID=3750 RepID=A0A498KP77_MALDO|nr:hypothetical protein DVH24_033963 [Malus domestica]